jgi:signal transduction histidine kinase
MRRRLLLSYLSLVLLVLVILEVSLGALADRHERSLLASQAVEEATGLAIVAAEDLQHGVGLSALVHRYHQAGGSEVLIVYASGTEAVDSDNDPTSDRREIARQLEDAASGRTATGTLIDEHLPFVFGVVPVHLEGTGERTDTRVSGELALYLPATDMLRRIHDIWMLLALFGLFVALITALIGARLAAGLARPLAALEHEVARFGRGDLTARATATGPPEIQALAAQFNGMADQLQRLVRAHSEFVADASHQLRSPLAAIRLRLEILESEVQGDVLASVEAAGLEVQRLSRLVDGLLALTRTDGERAKTQAIDVAIVIAERVGAWSPLADERSVRLATDIPDPDPAWADLVPGDLEQILDNYLANALEATPAGRSIVVRLVREPDALEVTVNDEGLGMVEADLKRAFDRFWQGPNTPTGSSGLGLAIVQQLAERNHCGVALHASNATTGVTAALSIPRRHRAPASDAIAKARR